MALRKSLKKTECLLLPKCYLREIWSDEKRQQLLLPGSCPVQGHKTVQPLYVDWSRGSHSPVIYLLTLQEPSPEPWLSAENKKSHNKGWTVREGPCLRWPQAETGRSRHHQNHQMGKEMPLPSLSPLIFSKCVSDVTSISVPWAHVPRALEWRLCHRAGTALAQCLWAARQLKRRPTDYICTQDSCEIVWTVCIWVNLLPFCIWQIQCL